MFYLTKMARPFGKGFKSRPAAVKEARRKNLLLQRPVYGVTLCRAPRKVR